MKPCVWSAGAVMLVSRISASATQHATPEDAVRRCCAKATAFKEINAQLTADEMRAVAAAAGLPARSNNWRLMQALWVDLGGIAKGYAVDCAVELLQAVRASAGLVNAGGDSAFGSLAHAVHLHFSMRLMQVATLQSGALASSSHAELSAGETPHIDPRSGCSARSAATVVVQARSAAVADALTKVALLCPATADKICAAWHAEWRSFLNAPKHSH